jgi:hypothetical protein
MRRDDTGFDHEEVVWWRQQGKLAHQRSHEAASAVVWAVRDQETMEATDGREDDDAGN